MPDYVDKFADTVAELNRPQPKRKTGWDSMNRIQKSGLVAGMIIGMLAMGVHGEIGLVAGLSGWTLLYIGYVGGGLWKFRHALHFWWSFLATSIIHFCLLPLYVKIVEMEKLTGPAGRSSITYGFGLLIAEVLMLLYAAKKVGLWIHRRQHA